MLFLKLLALRVFAREVSSKIVWRAQLDAKLRGLDWAHIAAAKRRELVVAEAKRVADSIGRRGIA